ncbi:hypothetical protein CN425_08340 [Bacillus cereus]|uniref:Uncharacterized protein YyaB-like PH domain-containing protein n=1 Tax=Bacillus cereus TaxID=1396 RepID=A0A2A8PYJ4_BACCE|nr:PH domain-containing protein [Bacillus cereus]PEW02914.1 hypothetical protein CN425_08340 [Bacillus cereus]
MVFRANVNVSLIFLIFLVTFIMSSIPLLSLFMYETLPIVIILPVIFLILAGFILWYATSITYVFYEDYLLIKGGPFKSKISYEDITGVSSTEDTFTGYRITSSEKGIKLFYKSAIGGSIKVLPVDKIEFITELRNRCPNVQIPKFD